MSGLPTWRLRAGLALLVACMAHACLALGWMLHVMSRPEQLPTGPGHGLDVGLAQSAAQAAVPSGAAPETGAMMPTTLSAGGREGGLPAAPPSEGAGGGGSDDYLARVRAHLHRFRSLPEFAALEAGRVEVRFRIMPGGRVGAVQLQRSAGRAALDAAALGLVARAAPLPAPPDDRALELVVPIEFR